MFFLVMDAINLTKEPRCGRLSSHMQMCGNGSDIGST